MLLMCGDIESCPGPDQSKLDMFTTRRCLKIFHQNVKGLFPSFLNVHELLNRNKRMDVLSLSETHIIEDEYNDNDALFAIDG